MKEEFNDKGWRQSVFILSICSFHPDLLWHRQGLAED
jgi:hypothetical protein